MTAASFIAELLERYEDTPKAVVGDIHDLVQGFTAKDRKELWRAFLDSYTFKSPPNRAVFVQLAKQLGIEWQGTPLKTSYQCKSCGRNENDLFYKCPQCGNHEWIVIIEKEK